MSNVSYLDYADIRMVDEGSIRGHVYVFHANYNQLPVAIKRDCVAASRTWAKVFWRGSSGTLHLDAYNEIVTEIIYGHFVIMNY